MNETETRSLISPALFVYLGYCGWVERRRLLLRPKLEKAYQKNYAEWQTMSLEIRSEWIPVWLYRGLKRRVNIYPSVPIVSLLGRVPRTLQAPPRPIIMWVSSSSSFTSTLPSFADLQGIDVSSDIFKAFVNVYP